MLGDTIFFKSLFAFKHPICREAEYRELHNKVLYPSGFQTLLDNDISFNSSDNDQTCQGADFIL